MTTSTDEWTVEDAPPMNEHNNWGAAKSQDEEAPPRDAPYGYKANGEPYKRRPSTRPRSAGGAARKARKTDTDYRPGLNGIVQLIAAPLAFASPVDAVTVVLHAPNVVEAVQILAQEDAKVAMILDRIMQVGPYGALIGALIPFAAQLVANRKPELVAPLKPLGVMSPDELMARMQKEAA